MCGGKGALTGGALAGIPARANGRQLIYSPKSISLQLAQSSAVEEVAKVDDVA